MLQFDDKKDELKRITDTFGIDTELMKLCEEVGELLNECYKYNYTKQNKDRVEDEFADVLAILSQFAIFYDLDIKNVKNIFNSKIDRTVKRIDDGWYDKHR